MPGPRDKPRLRKVERQALRRGDERLIVLRDPTGIAEQVALPEDAGPILDALDGQRTLAQIRQSLGMRGVLDVPMGDLVALLNDLDDAGWLEGDAFLARWEALHREFVADPVRHPRHAGVLYPDDPDALAAAMHAALPDPAARLAAGSAALGVLAPHQPLPTRRDRPDAASVRAVALLDEVLRGLPPARELDLVVLLAADLHPGLLPHALTDKRLATPRGELPGAPDLVAAIERRLPWARREEIRLRDAVSVELAALTLQHLYDRACPPVLPILCGPAALAEGPEVDDLLTTMEHVLTGRRVLWWIAAELSHDGPAYGRPPLTPARREALEDRDRACLDALAAGRPAALARRCGDDELGRPSGAAALVSAARLLPLGHAAELVRYAAARPIGGDDGLVGLAAARLTRRATDDADDD